MENLEQLGRTRSALPSTSGLWDGRPKAGLVTPGSEDPRGTREENPRGVARV